MLKCRYSMCIIYRICLYKILKCAIKTIEAYTKLEYEDFRAICLKSFGATSFDVCMPFYARYTNDNNIHVTIPITHSIACYFIDVLWNLLKCTHWLFI